MKITIEITPEELMQLRKVNGSKKNKTVIIPRFYDWIEHKLRRDTTGFKEKRIDLFNECKNFHQSLNNISNNVFKKMLSLWSEENNYEFEDRIMKNEHDCCVGSMTYEFIRITKK